MTETPGSCVSENATLSQLDTYDDVALNELMCALNAPMEDESEIVTVTSAPPGINRYAMFSSVFICEVRSKMDHHTHRIL